MWFNIEDGFPQGGGFCNRPVLKVHVIKVNKGKIRPWLRDTYSKLNVGKRYPSGHHWMCLWLREKSPSLG